MAKVYVSSTVVDLKAERQAVMDWLVQAGHQPVHSYRPDSEAVRDSCLKDIAGCDVYVLILGHRYGFQPEEANPERLSITHLEFRQAGESKLPRIALLRTSVPDIRLSDLRDSQKMALVAAFDDEVRRTVRPAEFADLRGLIEGLSTGVAGALEKARVKVARDDPRVVDIVATLTKVIDDRTAEAAALRKRVGELEEQLRAAVVRTVSAAAQPGASEAAIAAADALGAGDTRPAEALLRKQERREAALAGAPGTDDAERRRQAAALAREQGALAMGRDVKAALAAYERAAEYEPEDVWTHYHLGDLHLAAGDLNAAMRNFRRGGEQAEARAKREPDNPEWQRDLSVSYNRLGDALMDQGHVREALEAFGKDLAIAQALAAREPEKTLWQRDLSVSYEKIGNVLLSEGDGPGALAMYRKALAIREALAKGDPDNARRQRELSVSYNKIGDALVLLGDGPGALESYRKDLAIAEALAASDPGNTQWQRDLSVSHDKIGEMLASQGDAEGALAAHRKGFEIAERLVTSDPANTEWQRDLAVSHGKIGDVLAAQEKRQEALEVYRKALGIREALTKQDPANAEWQRDLSVSHNEIGNVLASLGDGPGALEAYRKGLEIGEALAASDPANARWQVDVAASYAKLGSLEEAGDAKVRLQSLRRGRAILDKLKKKGRLHPKDDTIAWFDERIAELKKPRAG
jgi:tetratricopeptide (TPR) repeat protein